MTIKARATEADRPKLSKMIMDNARLFACAKKIVFEDKIFNVKLKKTAGSVEWFFVLNTIHRNYPEVTQVIDIRTSREMLTSWKAAEKVANEIMGTLK
jgi:hypothetical protein